MTKAMHRALATISQAPACHVAVSKPRVKQSKSSGIGDSGSTPDPPPTIEWAQTIPSKHLWASVPTSGNGKFVVSDLEVPSISSMKTLRTAGGASVSTNVHRGPQGLAGLCSWPQTSGAPWKESKRESPLPNPSKTKNVWIFTGHLRRRQMNISDGSLNTIVTIVE